MSSSFDASLDAAYLTTLADAVPQIVFIDNVEGAVEYWNARWYEYTGLTPEQSFGAEPFSVVHSDDRAILVTQFPRSLKTGKPFDMELRMRRAIDGDQQLWQIVEIDRQQPPGGSIRSRNPPRLA